MDNRLVGTQSPLRVTGRLGGMSAGYSPKGLQRIRICRVLYASNGCTVRANRHPVRTNGSLLPASAPSDVTMKVINIFRGSDAYVAISRDVGVAPTTGFHHPGLQVFYI